MVATIAKGTLGHRKNHWSPVVNTTSNTEG